MVLSCDRGLEERCSVAASSILWWVLAGSDLSGLVSVMGDLAGADMEPWDMGI